MAEISEKTKMIEKIKNYMKNNLLDGYIIPKNKVRFGYQRIEKSYSKK